MIYDLHPAQVRVFPVFLYLINYPSPNLQSNVFLGQVTAVSLGLV